MDKKMNSGMNKKKKILLICTFAVAIYVVIYVINKVDVTKYSISNEKIPEEFNNFKIVQLSDFHSSGYKDTTEVIINKVKKINPDIIVMTGDMISWEVENIENLKTLINELSQVSTIYYSDGNHEHLAEILKNDQYKEFMNEINSLGVITLKNNYVELTKDGESINLYEIDIPLDGPTGLYMSTEQLDSNYVKDTLVSANKEEFNMLLAHNPLFVDLYSKWEADLVLSGHMHGGVARIPILGIGILSTEKEYFPKYDAGKFKVDNTTMLINRGIGVSSIDLRVFNKPDISVITLKSK